MSSRLRHHNLQAPHGSGRGCALRDDAHHVVHHLEETAFHMEGGSRVQAQLALAEQRHHGRVARKYAHLSVERRSDDGLRLSFEQDGFR